MSGQAAQQGMDAERPCWRSRRPLHRPHVPREGVFPPSHDRVLSRRVTCLESSPHCQRGAWSKASMAAARPAVMAAGQRRGSAGGEVTRTQATDAQVWERRNSTGVSEKPGTRLQGFPSDFPAVWPVAS